MRNRIGRRKRRREQRAGVIGRRLGELDVVLGLGDVGR